MRSTIPFLALALVILWVVLRVALAITSGALHLLWVVAVIMFIFWLLGGRRRVE